MQKDTGHKHEPECADSTEDDIRIVKNSSTVHIWSWHSFVKRSRKKKRDQNLVSGGWSSTSKEVEGSEEKKKG